MPRDGGGPTNGRSLTYEALVKSLFTTISHAKEPDIPPRPQSRIGFRKNKSSRARNRLQQDRPLQHLEETAGGASRHSADSDDDTADSDTSDEWSTDSDTSDTTSSNDLRPCSTIPITSPPILVPDAFLDQDLPNLTIQTDLPVHPPSPLRPMFPHHGLSRSALQHQKWLWNTRYDEWMQWRADVESAEAEMGPYGGISSAAVIEPPPLRRSRVPSPMPPEVEHSPMGKKTELNEKIFPRTGDITALHDPQVARLDQTFSNYPLCTIQKVLFVCCMDTAARGRSPLSQDSGNVNHHSDSEDTDVPSSTTKGVEGEERALAPHDPPAPEGAFPLLTKLSWEQSWHTRWEVLAALVKMTEQGVLARGPATIPATVTTPIGLPVVARSLADVDESPNARVQGRFFFAGSEEPGVNDGCESDDDEEEDDYGEIVLNPRFALQRTMTEERVLGRPFLHAQILPVHRRSGIKALGS
ncbi:hypothetical protein DFH94DRAFT_761960 [Russula ochroleuca]|jgi:hypothetical protein|uniref:Uncharacterized protein n=1 Tax=Russula ochroleuca TaxID=152965 RepID=A0A9P5MQ41_9AGAM|nr:hypothetical protein DFH94DRAFT_761960 [Russula ochroleuca]